MLDPATDLMLPSRWSHKLPQPVSKTHCGTMSSLEDSRHSKAEQELMNNQPRQSKCEVLILGDLLDKQSKCEVLMKDLLDNRVEGKLLTKKKKRQPKLKQAFVQRNFQKYPIKNCVFDTALQKHVHRPGKYVKEFSKLELATALCCGSCYLSPCLMVGKRVDFVESLKDDHEDPDFAITNAETLAVILFQKFCGKLWMSRMKIKAGPPAALPSCVKDAIPRLLCQAVAEVNDKLVEPHEEVVFSDEFELTDAEEGEED